MKSKEILNVSGRYFKERERQKKIEYKRFKKINKFIGIDFGRLLKSSRP